jgi:2OG-Fe(II) oxygenase superfamily
MQPHGRSTQKLKSSHASSSRETERMYGVDLDRYPIDRIDSPEGHALAARCQADMAARGVSQLPGFLTPMAIAEILTSARQLLPQGWASESRHNVYFTPLAEAPPHSSGSMPQRSAKRAIAYDLLPADLPLRVIYESEALTEFVRRVLGKPTLYRSADPLDALEIAVFEPGEELGWHFDNSEFSITIMLQMPEGGGEFHFIRALRSEDHTTERGIVGVLKGDHDAVETLETAPGTLALFHGHHAMHRVTPVRGNRPRINTVLTYGEQPGMTLSPLTQKLFYGRNIPAPTKYTERSI